MQFTCYDIYFPLNTHKTLGGVIFSIFSWITLCTMPLEVQRVKGMSRSGAERLGLGVTTWPAGRSRGGHRTAGCGQAPLSRQLTARNPTERPMYTLCSKHLPWAELCQGPCRHWGTKQNQAQHLITGWHRILPTPRRTSASTQACSSWKKKIQY